MIDPERLLHLLKIHTSLQAHVVAVGTGCKLSEAVEWLEGEVSAGRMYSEEMAYHGNHGVPIGRYSTLELPGYCPVCDQEIDRDDVTIDTFYFVNHDVAYDVMDAESKTLIDILKMKPGRDLDFQIAKRLGWTFKKVTWTSASPADPGWMWVLVDPQGRRASVGSSKSILEAYRVARPPQSDVYVPEYSTDLNVALRRLPIEEGETLHFCCKPGDAEPCTAWIDTKDAYLGAYKGMEGAHVVCRAWLFWDSFARGH